MINHELELKSELCSNIDKRYNQGYKYNNIECIKNAKNYCSYHVHYTIYIHRISIRMSYLFKRFYSYFDNFPFIKIVLNYKKVDVQFMIILKNKRLEKII